MKKQMSYVPGAEEKELVAGCLKGDRRCQQKLFESYYGRMLGVCMRYATDRDDARDIVQDAFIKIFQKLSQYNFSSPLGAWMRRIAVNTAIDRYRSKATEPVIEDIDTAYTCHDAHDVVSDISHEEMLSCLNDLPDGYRLIFNMHVIEGFSHKEISELLNISEGTSKSQLSKAKGFLQKLLGRKMA
jgi:RNA polymerase sigma-70 factor (ECF subfamily)